jgi:F0F1-type ATP synthase alpha subunit
MTSSVFRQIRDIQNQAGKLVDGKSSFEELEEFSRYNEEMKLYLVKNLEQDEIVEHVLSIPNVLEVEAEAMNIPIYAMMILALFTVGLSYLYIKHVEESRRINLIQDQIREARGKYATLEFLLKATG